VLARRRADMESFVVLLMVLLSIRAVRFIPFAAMAMYPGLARDLSALAGSLRRRLGEKLRPALLQAGLFAAGLAALGHSYLASYPSSVRGLGAATWLLPVDVAAFLREHPPPGKMWNPLNLSGYLLYALSPGMKVFIDGRGETVYPDHFIEETLRASRDSRLLLKQVDDYDVTFAVVEDRRFRRPGDEILSHPGWPLVYLDDRAAVLVRRTPATSDYISRYAFEQLQVGTVLQRLSRWRGDPERETLAADVLTNVKRAPGSIRAHVLAAILHRQRGDQESYRQERKIIEELSNRRDVDVSLP
jgi:hypothetical protein